MNKDIVGNHFLKTDKVVFVSVIIPSYRDWERLQLCLTALKNQTYPKDYFEIIAVNNDPTDCPPARLLLPDNCTLVEEHKPGSYAARNRGISLAKGNIIAFTDSDCIPHPDWIQKSVEFLQDNSTYSRAGGCIEFSRGGVSKLAYFYEAALGLDQKLYVHKRNAAATANMITKKDVFDRVGLFDERLMSGGDMEWGERASKCGYSIMYVEGARVSHPARSSREIKNKAKRTMGGLFHIEKNKGLFFLLKLVVIMALPPLSSMARVLQNNDIPFFYRVMVCLFRAYVRMSSFYEILLLSCGKSARRS